MSGARSVGGDAGGGMDTQRDRPAVEGPTVDSPTVDTPAEDRAGDDTAHPTPGSGAVPHRGTGPRAPGLEAGLRTPGSEADPGTPGLRGGPAVPGLERGPRTVHLVGVGGAGMSGLARLLLAAGHRVTGSDRNESATLEALRALGAEVWAGHDGARLGRPDLVVASTAIRPANPELVAARILGVPVLGRAQLLALLMAGKVGIAVAGTHGKTTTTGMVVAILETAGLDPSFAVGGDFKASGINAAAGTGPHFVAEADESDGSFLELAPTVAVVTNVEADHLDHWGDLEAVRDAFRAFVARLPADGTAVLCADDQGALELTGAVTCQVVTYGFAAGAAVRGEVLAIDGRGARFAVFAGADTRLLGERAMRVSRPCSVFTAPVRFPPTAWFCAKPRDWAMTTSIVGPIWSCAF